MEHWDLFITKKNLLNQMMSEKYQNLIIPRVVDNPIAQGVGENIL